MHQHLVKIKSIKHITHDVLQIITERPPHYSFIPGQATEVAINKKDWKNEKRPFTFTSLPDSDFLEFAGILGSECIHRVFGVYTVERAKLFIEKGYKFNSQLLKFISSVKLI